MLRRCRLIISAWVSFLGFFSVQAFSQSIGGSITGFVGDPTGPVPQAEVRITNVATGQVRFWLTDDQGRYELREVPAGLYKLEKYSPRPVMEVARRRFWALSTVSPTRPLRPQQLSPLKGPVYLASSSPFAQA